MKKLRSLVLSICMILMISGMVLAMGEYYVSDSTPPYGKIEISEVTKVEGTDKVSVKVEIFAKDDMCKVNEIKYHLSTSSISNTAEITDWKAYTTNKVDTIEVTAGSKIYAVFKDKNGNTSLINKGESLGQTIVYDIGDGTNAPKGANTERVPGMPFVVTSQEPKKDGCFFLGWSIDEEANTPSFNAGDIIPADMEIGSSDTATLYAVYTDDETKLPEASNVLQIGDYVNYPVYYDNVSSDGSLTNYEGWRVISIENDGTINLVSAGVPLTYYHGEMPAESVTKIVDNFVFTGFTVADEYTYKQTGLNSYETLTNIFGNKYTLLKEDGVPKVRSIQSEDVLSVTGASNLNVGDDLSAVKYRSLFDIGESYWLASDYAGDDTSLLAVNDEGIVSNFSNAEYGVRPVVSLKPTARVTGKDTTGAWNIEIPTCEITFDANGGSGTMETLIKEENEEYTLPTCAFTAPENKEFLHWEVNGEIKSVGEKIIITDNTIVKAIWLEINLEVTGINESYEYTGSQIMPEPVVTANGVTLTKDTDYEVTYGENLNAGDTKGTVTVTFKGAYSGSEIKEFTITPKNISSVTMTLDNTDYTYDGTVKTPGVTVTDTTLGGLTEDTHYTVTWTNNTNAALNTDANAPTVTITGKGNYIGTKSVTFSILSAEMTVTAENISVTYDGTAHSAQVSVTTPATGATIYYRVGTALTSSNYTEGSTEVPTRTDVGNSQVFYYIVADNYNAKAGSVNILVNAREITVKPEDKTKKYDGSALTSTTTSVTTGSLASGHKLGTVETNGTITDVGTVSNTISTITILDASNNDVTSNYAIEKVPGTLTVTAQDSVTFTVTLSESTYEYDGTSKTPAVASVKDGTKTVAASDYDVVYSNNTDAGTAATVTVTGKGNYAGSTGSATFTITQKTLTLTAGSGSKTYDGTAITVSTVTSSGLVSGHVLSATTEGSQKNVGSSSNTIATYSVKSGSTDVTKNYNVKTVAGTLIVTKKTVTVSARTTTFNYTGSAIKPTATVSGAVTGETLNLTITTNPTSAINPGTHSATVTIGSVTGGNASIVNYTLTGDTTISFTILAKIAFEANGGSGTMLDIYQAVNSTYTLSECTFIPAENYEFAGWDVNGTVYEEGNVITIAENLEIKATWKLQKRTITFMNDYTDPVMVVEVDYGTEYILPSNSYTAPTYYEFSGWLVNGTTYAVGAAVTITEDTTIKPNWTKIQYTIAFDANGGTGSMSAITKDAGTSYTLPASTFAAPSSKTFSGWSVSGTTALWKSSGYTDSDSGTTVNILSDSEITNSNHKNNTNILMVLQAEGETTQVPVPTGFTYLEGTGDTGLVVKDSSGNEFVWIPVSDVTKMYTTGSATSLNHYNSSFSVTTTKWGVGTFATMSTPNSTSYREPAVLVGSGGTTYDAASANYIKAGFTSLENFATDMNNEFNGMIQSVTQYGGFYVGRYELGYENSEVVCKPGVLGLTAASAPSSDEYGNYAGSSETSTWYGLYKACKGFTQGGVQSSMIWGSQWDAMLNFIEDHALETAPGVRKLTGAYGNEYKHVHDTSTGLYDWTAIAYNNYRRAVRGGYYGNTYSASYRDVGTPTSNYNFFGTRVQLYIKVNEYTDVDTGATVNVLSDSDITNENLRENENISMVLQAEGETTQVPVPTGFTYYLGTGDTGLVVKDGSGNEFVWIPVNLTAAQETAYPDRSLISDMYGTGKYTLAGDTGVTTSKYGKNNLIGSNSNYTMTTPGNTSVSNHREPDFLSESGYDSDTTNLSLAGFTGTDAAKDFATDMVNEFNAMITSVEKYGGFYVGRYELGLDGSTIVCKPGMLVLTPAASSGTDSSFGDYGGSADTQTWYGLYKACKGFTQKGVQAAMIWGTQWDAMVNYIGDHESNLAGFYKTGENPNGDDEYKHVHDTSSNVVDYTATALKTYLRVHRGGDYFIPASASEHGNYYATGTSNGGGARVQLYIKN